MAIRIRPRRSSGFRLAVRVVRSMARKPATEPADGGSGRFSAIISENWPLVRPEGRRASSNRRAKARAVRWAARHRQWSRTCSVVSNGIECEVIGLDPLGEHDPEFLALNPADKLPVLVDGDIVMTESAAIPLYLAEKFPEKGLIPSGLADRAQMYRWIFFLVTEIEQPLWRIALNTAIYPVENRLPADIENATRDCKKMVAVLERPMMDREFVAGDHLSVAGGALVSDAMAAGSLALCAEALGLMEVIRDATIEYLRTRVQFGEPIGRNQALQHRMATVLLEIEQARSAVINAAARELGPQGIHVAHLVIDAGVDTAWVRERMREREGTAAVAALEPGRLMRPEAVAEAYWALHQQPPDAWTFEQEIRPLGEKW